MATFPMLPNIENRDTGTPKGRGAYALQAFQPDDVVEICPVIVFQCPYDDLPRELQERVFNWSVLARAAESDMVAIALGYGGLYNCDNPANMRYEAVTGESEHLMRFVAVRAIGVNEELTVNYSSFGGGAESDRNGWFDRLGIERILSN